MTQETSLNLLKVKKKNEYLQKEFLNFNELKLHADIKIVLYRLSCLVSI